MDPKELHLLFILLDSNLPTGGFVSSSGLESYAKHGFLSDTTYPSASSHSSNNGGPSKTPSVGSTAMADAVTEFARAEVENYSRSTGIFVREAWEITTEALKGEGRSRCRECKRWKGKDKARDTAETQDRLGDILCAIVELDQYHEASLLSHVSRRSSKAQGIAMLTLHGRGLSAPPGFAKDRRAPDEDDEAVKGDFGKEIVDGYKKMIRKGLSPGHLAVCWGVMTAALGLSADRAIHLHLFLHARSLLSSAVRLNLIGPYLSSQLLLHPFEAIIAKELDHARNESLLPDSVECSCDVETSQSSLDPWAWTVEAESGPATTWPLGELLMARHDLQHSRIFNT